jgi:hypothetical protein
MNAEERHKMLQDSVKENAALRARVALMEKVAEAARGVAQWTDACWSGGYAGNQAHPAYEDVMELRAALDALKEGK